MSLLAVVRTAFPPERFTVSPAVVVNAPDKLCVIAEPDVSPLVKFIEVADRDPLNAIDSELLNVIVPAVKSYPLVVAMPPIELIVSAVGVPVTEPTARLVDP